MKINHIKKKSNIILRVHVFAHSHMDLAWLDTFENNYDNLAKKVISSVIDSLTKDKNRKFVLSEVGFI